MIVDLDGLILIIQFKLNRIVCVNRFEGQLSQYQVLITLLTKETAISRDSSGLS